MIVIRSIRKMQEFSCGVRRHKKTIGFVPTMGALHEGHLSLIKMARKENNFVVVSIFVNPMQFGKNEDFNKYPHNLQRDLKLCRKTGADVVFYPDAQKVYPQNYKTYVAVEDLSSVLCGKFRPGHFKGVTTIVLKLFHIVQPDAVYLGQKDAQQAVIIKKMAHDLNISVKIKIMPTIRSKDGLALSSRNAYLNDKERKDATVLFRALCLAKDLIARGCIDTPRIIRKMTQLIRSKKTARIQYISIVDAENLLPEKRIRGRILIALAAWIGKTRLIDNILIEKNA